VEGKHLDADGLTIYAVVWGAKHKKDEAEAMRQS